MARASWAAARSLLQLAETVAISHHERWDGTGYPRGLKGGAIPVAGRIVAVADAFDAITNSRPYRPARSARVAIQLLRNDSDRRFEGRLVGAVERIVSAESHLYDVSSRSVSVA